MKYCFETCPYTVYIVLIGVFLENHICNMAGTEEPTSQSDCNLWQYLKSDESLVHYYIILLP